MVQDQSTLPPKEPRYPENDPLNWPPPPVGLRAFLVMLLPAERGERPVTGRLRKLTEAQLRWLEDTCAIERYRRNDTRRDGKGETP